MKKLILAITPLILNSCGGGSDAPSVQSAQAFDVDCSRTSVTINCHATPAGTSTPTGVLPGTHSGTNTGNTATAGAPLTGQPPPPNNGTGGTTRP